jgi:hypothetical protein
LAAQQFGNRSDQSRVQRDAPPSDHAVAARNAKHLAGDPAGMR